MKDFCEFIVRCALHIFMFCSLTGCGADFLDVRPDKALVVPQSIEDYRAILDNSAVMNVSSGLSEVSADDFKALESAWTVLSATERNTYSWQADLFENRPSTEWNNPYQQVFYANLVLDGLGQYDSNAADSEAYKHLTGGALFYRAIAFYHLLQLFAPTYVPVGADQLMGIPLKLTSRIDQPIKRANLKECYDQIVLDLKEAATLLPALAVVKSRPSRAAAFGLLARSFLIMGEYENSLAYADSCLGISSQLMDYNTLSISAARPFPAALPNGNPEVLFHNFKISYLFSSLATVVVDSSLYASYNKDDLRRELFFLSRGNGNYTFKGSYNASLDNFSGLAVDEVYLIRAECYARLGLASKALADLNTLLSMRWRKESFKPLAPVSAELTLDIVLAERRKQLVGRGLRWTDLRRLNLSSRYQKTMERRIGGQHFTLEPNHVNYVFPIPDNEIFQSGIEQNHRK